MRPLHLVVRVDANHEVGLAHAVRTSKIVKNLNTKPTVTVAGQDTNLLKSFFPNPAQIVPAISDKVINEADVFLGDCPAIPLELWQYTNNVLGIPTIAIDDYGGTIEATLIINGTVLDDYHRYANISGRGEVLSGANFALIDACFADTPWFEANNLRQVVGVIGSGNRASEWICEILDDGPNLDAWGLVNIIVGKAFPHFTEIKALVEGRNVTIHQGIGSPEMASIISKATVALITGGMIVYECLALGVPCVVFPQERNLIKEVEWFEQNHCICNLGFTSGMNMRTLDKAVLKLLNNAELRINQSVAGRALVDGRGISRATKAIDVLLSNLSTKTLN